VAKILMDALQKVLDLLKIADHIAAALVNVLGAVFEETHAATSATKDTVMKAITGEEPKAEEPKGSTDPNVKG
jgi:hypothetical protein